MVDRKQVKGIIICYLFFEPSLTFGSPNLSKVNIFAFKQNRVTRPTLHYLALHAELVQIFYTHKIHFHMTMFIWNFGNFIF